MTTLYCFDCCSKLLLTGAGTGGGASAGEASGGDSALMSAVLGVDAPEDDHPWIRRSLESIPTPVDASALQDSDAKLSKRQLEEVVQSVTKLTALQPMRSASQYAAGAQLRVRRTDRPESCFELLPYFRRLHRWLHVSRPVTAPSPLNLRRLRADGSADVVNEGSGDTGSQSGKRRRGGTAEDPRRRREIAAAKQARDAVKQRNQGMRGAQGQRASAGPVGVSTPVARRRRIQEMSSKPVWEHTPVWEGWLSVRQTYGLRVKYPTLQLAIPVIKINRGVVGAMQVESRIHVSLSADGTIVSQLWEHNGGALFSAILAMANRGQTIPSHGHGADHEVEVEAQAATTQIRMLLGLGSVGVLGILAAQLGHTSGF